MQARAGLRSNEQIPQHTCRCPGTSNLLYALVQRTCIRGNIPRVWEQHVNSHYGLMSITGKAYNIQALHQLFSPRKVLPENFYLSCQVRYSRGATARCFVYSHVAFALPTVFTSSTLLESFLSAQRLSFFGIL